MVKHTFGLGSSACCIRFRGRFWFLKLVRDKSILFLSSFFDVSLRFFRWNSFGRSVKSDRRFSLFSKIDYDIKRLTMETHFFFSSCLLNEAGALERLVSR